MSMHVGVQLIAPNGFEMLEKDRVYHLLKSDGPRERVLLLTFEQREKKPTLKAKRAKNWTPHPLPTVIAIRRASFERGLLEEHICRDERQSALPPWLAGLTTSELTASDQGRAKAVKLHATRIDEILGHLWPLLERLNEVLSNENPDRVINRHARSCVPPQNETRMRTWFYAYLCFGHNRLALHYPVHKIGVWDRLSKPGQKFGRKSPTKGGTHGFGSNDQDLINKCLEGYRRFAGLGIHLAAIYRKTLTEIFGCIAKQMRGGAWRITHPDGLPFPTFGQFEYQVNKVFPLSERRVTKFGQARSRNRNAPSIGPFAESVGCNMERTEEDGYWVKEVAEGYLEGSHLPALVVVRIRCVASGMLVGIGFSIGGESASAYRMARFCMAIDKVKFCALFGMEIAPDEWPCAGLSPHRITDRGPGSTAKADSSTPQGRVVIKEMTPGYMGQSKANIESSNPRSIKIEGKPSFVTTRMTLPQLAVREIVRTVKANMTADISSRLNNKSVINQVAPTPLALWNYLDERGRSYAIPMTFDDAVRAFLTPTKVTARLDGVYLAGQRFDSAQLRESGALDRVPAEGRFELPAYMADICVRHLWIQVNDCLVEVDAQLSLRDGDDQLFVSFAELEQIEKLRRQSAADFQEQKHAVTIAMHQRFEETTGVPFDQGTRRAGRSRRRKAMSAEEHRQIIDSIKAKAIKS